MEWVIDLLKSAFGAGIVAGLFGLIQWRLNRKAHKEDKVAERKVTSCAQRGQEIHALQQTVNALIVADRTILYDRIKHLAKEHIRNGFISVEDYEDLKRMHHVYHDKNLLNGNGFLDALMFEVDRLEKRVVN